MRIIIPRHALAHPGTRLLARPALCRTHNARERTCVDFKLPKTNEIGQIFKKSSEWTYSGHRPITKQFSVMAYSGSCPDMCPEKERQARFGLYMSIFERDKDNQPNEFAMIKEYRRSGADQDEPLPEDLRTPRALQLTIDYLAGNIMDDSRSTSQELSLEWYDFLWDRLRAVRKDITQQNMCDQAAAILVERCARFHVHSCYAMNRVNNFDVDMNKRNLNDCLQMLRQMYTDLKQKEGILCPGELEIQKYDILLHLNEDHLSSNLLMKTSDHRNSSDMRFIIRVFNAYTNNDYYKFFQLMEQADYMTSCLLSLYANKMRLSGMKMIAVSSTSRQSSLYPTDLIINTLGFDGLDDLYSFALALGIEIQDKDSRSCLVLTKELISRLRRSDTTVPPFKSFRLVESKMQNCSVGQLVYGPTELYNQPIPDRLLTDQHMEILEEEEEEEDGEEEEEEEEDEEEDEDEEEEEEEKEEVPSQQNTKRPFLLMINSLGSSDVGQYKFPIEMPHAKTETPPIPLSIDRTMRSGQRPSISQTDMAPPPSQQVPEVVNVPEEVVTTMASSPHIEAQIFHKPEAKVSSFEDIQPIVPDELRNDPLEVVKMPAETPDSVRQALEIDDQKPGKIKPPRQRQEIADMMPVGKFKRRVFSSKINIRRSPEPSVTSLPKRMKPNEKRDILNSISMQIKVEDNVNKLFTQLASMTTTTTSI